MQVPNILRVMAFHDVAIPQVDHVAAFAFVIDDRTPENLAIGLNRIRLIPGSEGEERAIFGRLL